MDGGRGSGRRSDLVPAGSPSEFQTIGFRIPRRRASPIFLNDPVPVLSVACRTEASAEVGEFISAFPRKAFGKRDRRATGPRPDRA